MLLGGHGNISVTANVAPRAMSDLCRAALAGDVQTARALHMKLLSLHKNLFIEANPIPVKWALQAMGKMQGGIRLPLTALDERCHEAVRSALVEAGVSPDAEAAASAAAGSNPINPHRPAPSGAAPDERSSKTKDFMKRFAFSSRAIQMSVMALALRARRLRYAERLP